ncbi:MAG: hypothetical protein Q7J14_01590 [Candidatus Magasanikbacteria bacterium]|nr:hypothetical protein [Candidatus Magasanikbacteria bacterium]
MFSWWWSRRRRRFGGSIKKRNEMGTGDGPEFQPGNNYEGIHEIIQVPVGEVHSLNLLPLEIKELVLTNYNNTTPTS